jgi:hypothetical protein
MRQEGAQTKSDSYVHVVTKAQCWVVMLRGNRRALHIVRNRSWVRGPFIIELPEWSYPDRLISIHWASKECKISRM